MSHLASGTVLQARILLFYQYNEESEFALPEYRLGDSDWERLLADESKAVLSNITMRV
jgi:hypothetical protein